MKRWLLLCVLLLLSVNALTAQQTVPATPQGVLPLPVSANIQASICIQDGLLQLALEGEPYFETAVIKGKIEGTVKKVKLGNVALTVDPASGRSSFDGSIPSLVDLTGIKKARAIFRNPDPVNEGEEDKLKSPWRKLLDCIEPTATPTATVTGTTQPTVTSTATVPATMTSTSTQVPPTPTATAISEEDRYYIHLGVGLDYFTVTNGGTTVAANLNLYMGVFDREVSAWVPVNWDTHICEERTFEVGDPENLPWLAIPGLIVSPGLNWRVQGVYKQPNLHTVAKFQARCRYHLNGVDEAVLGYEWSHMQGIIMSTQVLANGVDTRTLQVRLQAPNAVPGSVALLQSIEHCTIQFPGSPMMDMPEQLTSNGATFVQKDFQVEHTGAYPMNYIATCAVGAYPLRVTWNPYGQ